MKASELKEIREALGKTQNHFSKVLGYKNLRSYAKLEAGDVPINEAKVIPALLMEATRVNTEVVKACQRLERKLLDLQV